MCKKKSTLTRFISRWSFEGYGVRYQVVKIEYAGLILHTEPKFIPISRLQRRPSMIHGEMIPHLQRLAHSDASISAEKHQANRLVNAPLMEVSSQECFIYIFKNIWLISIKRTSILRFTDHWIKRFYWSSRFGFFFAVHFVFGGKLHCQTNRRSRIFIVWTFPAEHNEKR